MKFEHGRVFGIENAFHGLRHPMESYKKSDSYFGYETTDMDQASIMAKKWTDFEISQHPDKTYTEDQYDKIFEAYFDFLIKPGIIHWDDDYEISEVAYLGPNDLALAQRMIAAGSPNDKFLRQIFVSVDVTAPLYW